MVFRLPGGRSGHGRDPGQLDVPRQLLRHGLPAGGVARVTDPVMVVSGALLHLL
jgi:hypothetical protein